MAYTKLFFFFFVKVESEVAIAFKREEKDQMALEYESLNENVKKCQYAVRGELYLRASELQKEGKKVFTLDLCSSYLV